MHFFFSFFFFLALNLGVFGINFKMSEEESWEVNNSLLQEPTFKSSDGLRKAVSRGLELLFLERYEEALIDFNHVLAKLDAEDDLDSLFFGVALWGRLFCYAYANQEKEAFDNLELIRSYFVDGFCYSCNEQVDIVSFSSVHSSQCIILKIASFENPGEKISVNECKERVRGTANIMRLLVMKIPNRMIADAINLTITELEHVAAGCCERSHWTECLDPIVNCWIYLKKCMDKGVAIAPNLVGPKG